MVTKERTETADRLGMAITRLARLLRQQAGDELTPTMRAMIGSISSEGPVTLGDLASIERVAPPTITKVIAKLEERGFVEREPDPSDRRVSRVALTELGRRWLDSDRRRRHAWLAGQVQKLDDRELDTLAAAVEILERITAPEVVR
jgi:DNA-binding MarR family transcriptional regulator